LNSSITTPGAGQRMTFLAQQGLGKSKKAAMQKKEFTIM
jgi:flagellar biosynthesis/type III secretory pathway ATPase